MPGRSPPTALPATDNYLATISEGAVKTGSAGRSGKALGSPTFSPPGGGFLTGEIIQRDRTQARRGLMDEHGVEAVPSVTLAVSKVQTANQLVSKCRRGTCREINYSVKLWN